MNRSFAFVFVCQQGALEIKSALLAASLKRHLRCDYELIAAIPGPAERWAAPAEATVSFLKNRGARIVTTGNEIDPTYPIANKVDCLRVTTAADKLVFLDSDMILLRQFVDQPRFGIPFNARPASYPTYSAGDVDWKPIYAACGAPMPTARVRTTYSGEYILPYFNAAFVAVPGQSRFGDAWLECCKIIDRLDVPNKRPYLDQIALGVAAAKLGLEMDALDERFNHPINFKPLCERDLPLFCHYHDPQTLRREPAALAEVQSLLKECPELVSILAKDPQWESIARLPAIVRRGMLAPELVITGIPRSGTSYLCNLLHKYDNCVIINEPIEAPAALLELTLPFGVARLYRDIRRDVVAGTPIRNKRVDGKVIEDTALANNVETYLPKVSGPDFVLGIKATIAFLSRLPELRRVLPDGRFVACVRNPMDTIASWKGSFRHLREADVDGVNIGNSDDPWLSGAQRKELKAIAAIPDPSSRRAAWWDYFARLILDFADDLILVRYDDLILRPNETAEKILQGWPAGRLAEPVAASQIRRRTEDLDADDIAAIRAICRQSAEALGLALE